MAQLIQIEQMELARVQKVALRIILKSDYENYTNALKLVGLETLHERRTILCKKFATNCTKNEKTCAKFPLNPSTVNTRHPEKFYVQPANTRRLSQSAIPYLQRLLNEK